MNKRPAVPRFRAIGLREIFVRVDSLFCPGLVRLCELFTIYVIQYVVNILLIMVNDDGYYIVIIWLMMVYTYIYIWLVNSYHINRLLSYIPIIIINNYGFWIDYYHYTYHYTKNCNYYHWLVVDLPL